MENILNYKGSPTFPRNLVNFDSETAKTANMACTTATRLQLTGFVH